LPVHRDPRVLDAGYQGGAVVHDVHLQRLELDEVDLPGNLRDAAQKCFGRHRRAAWGAIDEVSRQELADGGGVTPPDRSGDLLRTLEWTVHQLLPRIFGAAGPHPRGLFAARFARPWLRATVCYQRDSVFLCFLLPASCFLLPASCFLLPASISC